MPYISSITSIANEFLNLNGIPEKLNLNLNVYKNLSNVTKT